MYYVICMQGFLKKSLMYAKSVQVIVCLHIFPIFSFLAKMLSSLIRNDNIFARNESIGKIYKRTIIVSSVVEYPGAASSRLRTINSELNGAT